MPSILEVLFAEWEIMAYPSDGQRCPAYWVAMDAFDYAVEYKVWSQR